jgi:ABC-type sulfate transport system substrate-binding protein
MLIFEGFLICTDLPGCTQKRQGQKITTMNEIFSRKAHMPKIKITANELGQPVGENCRKFVSAIGCQVRKSLPVRIKDWRDVPIQMKRQVWTALEV